MTSEQEQALLDQTAARIRALTETAYADLIQRIQNGEAPRDAIAAVTAGFAGEYYAELSVAFSAMLAKTIGAAEIKAWPVGEVALSERLYAHTREVNAATERLIRNHREGFVQARTLALQIYEGYEFQVDPLQVKARLPKYLRLALRDPAISQGYSQILARIRANQLKTPALRAAYLQAIDALEAGAGAERLQKMARIAWYERNRYFANRIAQTELHRAYEDQKAIEMMDDQELAWVQIKLSVTHHKPDVCDYHARLDRYGQGPGVYPKAEAPKPGFHPFCRCRAIPRYDIDADTPQVYRRGAHITLMQSLSDYDQRLVAGSRDRLKRFRDGESIESIHDQATRKEYRLKRLGDIKPPPQT